MLKKLLTVSSKEVLFACIHCIMVIEAAMLQSSSKGSMKINGNGAKRWVWSIQSHPEAC